MGLDLRLVDGKLVSINHLQTDGQTKRWTELLRYLGLDDFKDQAKADNFYIFCLIDTKITLKPGK